jgi:hypothetical protein
MFSCSAVGSYCASAHCHYALCQNQPCSMDFHTKWTTWKISWFMDSWYWQKFVSLWFCSSWSLCLYQYGNEHTAEQGEYRYKCIWIYCPLGEEYLMESSGRGHYVLWKTILGYTVQRTHWPKSQHSIDIRGVWYTPPWETYIVIYKYFDVVESLPLYNFKWKLLLAIICCHYTFNCIPCVLSTTYKLTADVGTQTILLRALVVLLFMRTKNIWTFILVAF